MSDRDVKILVCFKVPEQFEVGTTKKMFLAMVNKALTFCEDTEITEATADACIKALLQTPEVIENPLSIICDAIPDFPLVPVILTQEDIQNDIDADGESDREAGQLEYQVSDGLPGMGRGGAFHEAHFDEAVSVGIEAQKKHDERLGKKPRKHSRTKLKLVRKEQ